MEYGIAIYRHDGMQSIVTVNAVIENGTKAWITFGEVTDKGFNPCYASLLVPVSDIVSAFTPNVIEGRDY